MSHIEAVSDDGHIWDLITIGGGPAGLMCSITAVSGIPIEPPRHFSALVIDAGRIGQFARHGKLRLTHQWHFMGDHLIESLEHEALAAGVTLHEHERAVGVELHGEVKTVRTEQAVHRGRGVAICTGFFPHGALLEHRRGVRPVFSPAGLEARVITARDGETLAVLGAGPSTVRFARDLRRLRPDLRMLVVLEDADTDATEVIGAGAEVVRGRIGAVREEPDHVRLGVRSLDESPGTERRCCLLLIDYNSYTTSTRITAFLEGTGLERRQGYIVTDRLGNTSIPGVVAAGNITTPVSGVLTALSTGFTAGLAIHRWLFEKRFGTAPDSFPWLPREGLDAHPLGG
jgi:thioredoxin reductase (NADPH)